MAISKLITNSLADNAITSDKIENGAVNNAKINASANIAITKTVLAGTQPTISGLSISQKDPSSASNVVISGTNFESIPTVQFLNTTTGARITSATVTYTSAGSITAVFPASQTIGIYKVIVENPTGLGTISTATLLNSAAPNWVTNASLGSVTEGETVNIQLLAYDDDSSAVSSYSLVSGSLPSGVTLSGDSSVGALTGTAPTVSADTAHNFTIRATDNESQTTDKAFSLTVADFSIDNSLRFNDGDNAELTRTPSSESNKQIHTISMWIKRCTSGSNQALFSAGPNDSSVYSIRFIDDSLYISQSSGFVKDTSRLFRDPSAWYHIVIAVDTTNATQNDRIKVYINGVLETSFAENTFAGGQNFNTNVNDNVIHAVGYDTLNDSVPFDGYIADFHLIDGTQKAASDFGETNSNGVWIPKPYTGTYGTNGVYLKFKQTGTGTNSSGIGADTSGNNNHYAVTNLAATDQTTDSPLLNYATLNPLAFGDNTGTLSEGNLKHTHNGGDSDVVSTMGISSGKFYAEFKVESNVSGRPAIAVYNDYDNGASDYGSVNGSVLFLQDGRILVNNSSIGDFGSISQNDIIQVAVDNDNGAIYIGQNGNYLNSGNPTSGSSRTGSVSNFTAGSVTCFIGTRANSNSVASANFGNPAFSISSSNSDANGYGSFEYAVPSGYYALNSKNLATYG